MVELLSPVGDFECLKAAVQNGANAVYFGANLFSARSFATNFDEEELEKAITYAKLRNVKTHLTLNTLIKDTEFEDAFNLAKKAYSFGIDAIIVQDIGLATKLIKEFPDLDIHASTQMTTTNLEALKELEQIGFKRVVLSRECSLSEIENICKNTDMEIEVFIHGALCISYSGQCLFSSMVGGRSGNRGKCAQPCRLPYSLISEKDNKAEELDKGYLLSTRDLCSLENLPQLISSGVKSFKIEGRMKSPIYVATVTKIYRKYIDLATKFLNKEISNYEIEESDKKELMQVFNRGGFSKGHQEDEPNKNLVFPKKPNNMGIYLGKILKYNQNKGLVTVKLEDTVSIGDGIGFENETTKYTISELMDKKNNIKIGKYGDIVTFGRMKGNIKVNDKIYKISDKDLSNLALKSFEDENIKNKLYCKLEFKQNEKVKVYIKSLLFDIEVNFEYDYIPEEAKNAPITVERIKEQFNKTLNTCFEFSDFEIDLDNNLFIPTSILNDIRRTGISIIEEKIVNSFKRNSNYVLNNDNLIKNNENIFTKKQEKSILLNVLDLSFDYSKLKQVDRIYIPLKYFADKKYGEILKLLSSKSKLYIYMPVVIKDRFFGNIKTIIEQAFKTYKIYGAVVSEYSSISIFKSIKTDIIANYTFNIFNSYSQDEVLNLGFSLVTSSPELEKEEINNLENNLTETVVYGKIPLMTTSYCLLGKSNRCYEECKHLCLENNKYYLSDRYNFKFRVIPDNIQTLTTIYNSRNIDLDGIKSNSLRYDFLDETIEEINNLI